MKQKGTSAEHKFFREMDKKAALSEAEKLRQATLKKTAKLRALRLEKEEAERAEEALKPKTKAKLAKKRER